MATIAS